MIVPFTDNVTGVTVYINPAFVVSVRPDPEDPLNVSEVKLQDGEVLRVRGAHGEVADRLSTTVV